MLYVIPVVPFALSLCLCFQNPSCVVAHKDTSIYDNTVLCQERKSDRLRWQLALLLTAIYFSLLQSTNLWCLCKRESVALSCGICCDHIGAAGSNEIPPGQLITRVLLQSLEENRIRVYPELLLCPCVFVRLLLSCHLKLSKVQIIHNL